MLSSFRLSRIPNESALQAWNAADELFLRRDSSACRATPTLILNDPFGALAVALADCELSWWNDSAMAAEALAINCRQNNCPPPALLDTLPNRPTFGCAVLHLPKSLNFFAWQLEQLQQCLHQEATVFILGMVKHISSGHIALMSRYFTKVNPGRAEKKARVVQLRQMSNHRQAQTLNYDIKPLKARFSQLPGCFAEQSADPGALVFIDYLQSLTGFKRALDLGCGNGVLSYALLQRQPGLHVTLVDDSRQAIASAQENMRALNLQRQLRFRHANGGNGLGADERFDLIVCNPPFHQGFTLTESIAERLIADAQRLLADGGEFWLVANRHLPYFALLKQRFGQVSLRSSHPKFTVYCAQLG